MMIKLKIFLLYFLIGLLIVPLRSGKFSVGVFEGFYLSSLVGFVVIYLITLFLLLRLDEKFWVLLLGILGVFCLTLPIRILNFSGTLVSLPESLVHLFAFLSAYLGYRVWKRKILYMFVLTASIAMTYYMSYPLYKNWLNYLNVGSWDGVKKEKKILHNAYFYTASDSISLISFKEDLIVLEFWSSSCGLCLKSFPKTQELYDTYKDKGVGVYAVYVGTGGETFEVGSAILQNLNYSFPMLFLPKGASALSEFGVKRFPTVAILNNKGEYLFCGNIELAMSFLHNTVVQ